MSETTTTEATPETEAPEAEETTTEQEPFDQARAMAKIKKANDEARGLRQRIKDLEQYEAKVRADEESQKTESQKIQESATKAEQRALAAETSLLRERVARRHKLDDDDMDLLGSGNEDEIEARAKRIAALKAAAEKPVAVPPSEKPVEKLRPGATSTDRDISSPDAFPAHWRTAKSAPTSKGIGNG